MAVPLRPRRSVLRPRRSGHPGGTTGCGPVGGRGSAVAFSRAIPSPTSFIPTISGRKPVDNPRLAQALAETGRLIRSMLATAVHNGKECGEVPDDTDQDLTALELHSLAEGLALRLGSNPDAATSRTALTLASARVQAVFPGLCRQYE
ncbi:TetR family transcriptional regulator C-terminal domain-containing protein [Streptomyces anulatus]